MPNITAASCQQQWARLVLKLLATLGGCRQLHLFQPIVSVADELDLCDSERDVATVLGLLARVAWSRRILTAS